MKMLMFFDLPHEKFNAAVRDGSADRKMRKILDEAKPEAVYFTETDGHRGGVMLINVDDPSKVPFYAEPWFLTFDAGVRFRIVMTPEDLGRAGLEALGKKWA
ncbi:MAG: panthothenate synthetase [Acidobacteriota bacterium]